MGGSRTLLYRKINEITGMSIKEFILDMRLKRSAQLLEDTQMTIAEVAYQTGFSDAGYFSVCFNIMKMRYMDFDRSIESLDGFVDPTDKINIFISMETILKNLCSIRDLDEKVMNAERMVLRYQDDDQSKFVHFEFLSFPMYMDYSSGAIEGRITFSSDGKIVTYAMSFVILKDEADKYWLWNMENRMGIIAEF